MAELAIVYFEGVLGETKDLAKSFQWCVRAVRGNAVQLFDARLLVL